MPTKRDVALMLWPAEDRQDVSSQEVSIRWGSITEDVGDGWYKVKLDGTDTIIEAYSDSPHNVGDRVQVIWQGNRFVIIGNQGLIDEVAGEFGRAYEAIEDVHQTMADEMGQVIGEAFDEANKALEDFKAAHTLTDADITKSITDTKSEITETFEGKLSDLGEVYTTKTEFSRGISGVKSEVSETYSTKSETSALETSLKSQITQSASSVQTTVEQSVNNKLGNYYSKTEWTQGATGYTATVHQAVETTDNNKSFIDTNFTMDSYGLTVGSSAHTYKSRVGTQGFSILQNSTELAKIIASGTYTQISSQSSKALQLYSAGETNLFSGFLTIRQNQQYSSFTATATDNTGYLLGASRLFWNFSGTNAAFQLSRSVSNYSFIEVHYTDGQRRLTKRCTNIDTSCSIMLDRSVINTNQQALYIDCSILNISGTSATFQYAGNAYFANAGNAQVTSGNEIKVLSVTGWR